MTGFVNPQSSSSWAKLRRMIFPEKPGEKLDLAQRKAAAAGMIQGGLMVDQAPNSSLMTISFDSRGSGMGAEDCECRGGGLYGIEPGAALRNV